MSEPPPAELIDAHARAAARLAGLTIEEAWWPGVVGHLTILLDQAWLVERHPGAGEPSPAPSFRP